MKRFLFAALLLAATLVCRPGLSEQIKELPNDSQKPYLTVVGTAGEAKYEALKQAFQKHEGLKEFAASTHFTIIADHTTLYLARYSREYGRLPVVRLQEADGDVIYEVSGREIPSNDVLCDELNSQGATATCVRKKQQYQQHQGIDVAPVDKKEEISSPPKRSRLTPDFALAAWCVGAGVLGFGLGVFKVVMAEWAEGK